MRNGGYGGFSFRDLAAEIGIKSASVHNHFPTKAAMAAAVARRPGAANGQRNPEARTRTSGTECTGDVCMVTKKELSAVGSQAEASREPADLKHYSRDSARTVRMSPRVGYGILEGPCSARSTDE